MNQEEQIAALPIFVARSSRMLILWDDTYFERPWAYTWHSSEFWARLHETRPAMQICSCPKGSFSSNTGSKPECPQPAETNAVGLACVSQTEDIFSMAQSKPLAADLCSFHVSRSRLLSAPIKTLSCSANAGLWCNLELATFTQYRGPEYVEAPSPKELHRLPQSVTDLEAFVRVSF